MSYCIKSIKERLLKYVHAIDIVCLGLIALCILKLTVVCYPKAIPEKYRKKWGIKSQQTLTKQILVHSSTEAHK